MSPPFILHNTFGAAFVGLVVASMLHGVSIVQAWYYYGHQSDDWVLKSLVAAVMTFDTVHQAVISHAVYTYTITYWGDPSALQKLVWSNSIEVLFNGLTAFLVQSFMVTRVWRFSNRNIWLTGLVALLVLAEFVCLLAYTILQYQMDTFAQLVRIKSLSIAVNALAAAGDVLIAGALCLLLHLSRTGFSRSDTMINKLMVFAINTGLLTSLFAVASLISFLVAGNTFIYIAFFFCMGRLYTNSLLATLNARKMIRRAADSISNSTGEKLNVSLREFPKNGSNASRQAANISIKINTTKEFVTDRDQDQDMDKTDASDVQVFEDKNKRRSFPDV